MTIAAAYLVSDGVVFGADSSTTVSGQSPAGQGGVLQLLNHAQKVFEVGQNSRLGVCTWGAGSFGEVSHRAIIARLADRVSQGTTVADAAHQLRDLVEPLVNTGRFGSVGYYLGGWNYETHQPDCYKIEITPQDQRVDQLPLGLCSFSGMPVFFTRVFRGFDPELPLVLLQELRRLMAPTNLPPNFDQIFNQAFQLASSPLAAAGYQDLPIREAIDFIYSYLHITVKAIKFKFGAPTCGGPIEVGFITTDRFFRWVRHKNFASAILEEEADYVRS